MIVRVRYPIVAQLDRYVAIAEVICRPRQHVVVRGARNRQSFRSGLDLNHDVRMFVSQEVAVAQRGTAG